MQTYIITEKQNFNSQREGTQVECKGLTAAKRLASKNQLFQGTVLEIAAPNGAVLSRKNTNGKWENE